MQDKYDIIIIGSGLGGLVCGAILGKEGYNVCIAEQCRTAGGCLQSFVREGYTIDTGVHYAGSMGEGQIMSQYLNYLGIADCLHTFPMDNAFDIINMGGKEFRYVGGYDNFFNSLAGEFPKEKKGLEKYIDTIKEIGSSIDTETHRRGMLSSGKTEYLGVSAYEFIKECTEDRLLQNILAATNILYGGVKEASSLYHHAMTNHSNIEGAYKFAGGTQHIADALVKKIQECGGTVMTGCRVCSIEAEGDKINSIRLENGRMLYAGKYISSLSPLTTLNLITGSHPIKKAYRTRLSLLPGTYGLFSAYLLMREKSMPYINSNFYIYGKSDAWDTVMKASDPEPKAAVLSSQRKNIDDIYSDVITVMVPMEIRDFEKWNGTCTGKRGEDYIRFKEMIAEKIIKFTEERHSGIAGSVKKIYTASPLTWRDYLGNEKGSAYGILKDYRNAGTTLFPVRTRLENLFLTGQNVNVHGVIGVTMTAAVTCSNFLGEEYLAKKVGSAYMRGRMRCSKNRIREKT